VRLLSIDQMVTCGGRHRTRTYDLVRVKLTGLWTRADFGGISAENWTRVESGKRWIACQKNGVFKKVADLRKVGESMSISS
jgi:sarcosine oxidase delta subunit